MVAGHDVFLPETCAVAAWMFPELFVVALGGLGNVPIEIDLNCSLNCHGLT